MSEANLEILASRAGLAVDWIDANGRPQHVKPGALRAVLKGLGHPADTDAEINASLLELEQVQQDKHLPPLMTVDSGEGLDLARYFAADTPCRVSLETGDARWSWLNERQFLCVGQRLPATVLMSFYAVE